MIAGFLLVKPVMAEAEAPPPNASASPTGGPGMEMLTIFLRHDQSKTAWGGIDALCPCGGGPGTVRLQLV
jgi:hypothetical protein